MTIAQTHNSALKRLLEADLTDVRRQALEFMAINAALEKQIKLLQDRCSTLEYRLNAQERANA